MIASTLAACSFPSPSEQYACDVTADCDSGRTCDRGFCVLGQADLDASDSDATTSFDCTGWTPRHFDPCMIPTPSGPLTLSMAGTYTYDTATGTLTDPANGTSMPPSMMVAAGRVVSVASFNVTAGATLFAIGPQPVIVASWSTIEIAGVIDVSSTATTQGAGGNATGCAIAGPGEDATAGAGGGGGGGYGTRGGDGGRGDAGDGGLGGIPIVGTPLLRGGCAGGRGGNGVAPGGVAGGGGGAFQLTARSSIALAATAKLHAGGAGGGGASANRDGGGGGAGSGGMVSLEAATITAQAGAVMAANGGGGGGGASDQAGTAGQPGQPSATQALGGPGGADAGAGGLGAATMIAASPGVNDANRGAGGGGGGVGFVVITSPAASFAGGVVSPPATIVPPL